MNDGSSGDVVPGHDMVNAAANFGVAGGIDLQRMAEQVPDEVGVVNVEIKQCSTRLGTVKEEALAPSGRFSHTTEARGEYFAIAVRSDSILEPGPSGPEAKAHGGHEHPVRLAGGGGHFACLFGSAGHGFLAKHMLARFQRGEGEIPMRVGGGADVHDRDRRIRQHFIEAAVAMGLAHVELQRLIRAEIAGHIREVAIEMTSAGIAQRGDVYIGHLQPSLQMRGAHEAQADEADAVG